MCHSSYPQLRSQRTQNTNMSLLLLLLFRWLPQSRLFPVLWCIISTYWQQSHPNTPARHTRGCRNEKGYDRYKILNVILILSHDSDAGENWTCPLKHKRNWQNTWAHTKHILELRFSSYKLIWNILHVTIMPTLSWMVGRYI